MTKKSGRPRKKSEPILKRTFQITAPHFCAGLSFEGDEIVDAAPIIYWMLAQCYDEKEMRKYCKQKKWKVEEI